MPTRDFDFGDLEQYVEIHQVRYSHIVDPRSGIGITGRYAVTVIADDATTTDAVATALAVLGPERGREVIGKFPRAAARFVSAEGDTVRVTTTPGFGAD